MQMDKFTAIIAPLQQGTNCVLVTVQAVQGSAPREVGAWMVVAANAALAGTIGGGALEWNACKLANQLLVNNKSPAKHVTRQILGPDLNQCCGGQVELGFEVFTPASLAGIKERQAHSNGTGDNTPLYIFGAGHVGQALARAAAPLDFDITLVDARADMLAEPLPGNVAKLETDRPCDVLQQCPQGTFVVIMSHSHDLDFALCRTALQSPQVAFTGMIGSKTKRARFNRRLTQCGLLAEQIEALVCPLGREQVRSKKPAAIAAAITVQLLAQSELVKTAENCVRLPSKSA